MIKETKDVKLLIYSTTNDQYFLNLSNAISGVLTKEQIFTFRNIEKFSGAVRYMLSGLGVILIILRNEKELNDVFKICDRLKDHSIILILDNKTEDLTNRALQLYPRYTSYIKEDSNDVYLVLEKMITNIHNKIKGYKNGGEYRYH